MLSFSLISIIFIITLSFINSGYDVSKLKISSKTDQIMLVIPTSYKSHFAEFYYYIKSGNTWKEFIYTKANIGKNGVTSSKVEGDMKSPIGCFKFNKYFGRANNPDTKMPYIKLNNSLYWVSDPNSSRYDQMVNIETYTAFDKSKSEHLIEETVAYKYAMNIYYNQNAIPNKGSAIFLHCLTKSSYTAGCVAISETNMIKVLKKVNKNAMIVIDIKENIYKY